MPSQSQRFGTVIPNIAAAVADVTNQKWVGGLRLITADRGSKDILLFFSTVREKESFKAKKKKKKKRLSDAGPLAAASIKDKGRKAGEAVTMRKMKWPISFH